MPRDHKWSPISDLGDDPNALTDGELDSLLRVWQRQRREMIEERTLDEFDKRLRREWSIETGIIESVYTLDRGVTRTLIEKGIDAAWIPHGASNRDSALVARIIQDHYDALEGMFDFIGGQRQLSTGYIKELHAALLRNQETYTVVDPFGYVFEKPLEKGLYKTMPNNPTRPDGSVYEYCPPEHVSAEMDRLLEMHTVHGMANVAPEVEAAWLHHRFAQIHPFPDGNGRVARALASLVFIKAGWFPLIVKRDDWTRYIDALETADDGNLRPLVTMFVEAQRNAVIQATDIAYEVRPIESTDEAVAAVRERLQQRGKLPAKEWLAVKDTSARLANFVKQRLEQLASQLQREIPVGGHGQAFRVEEFPSSLHEPSRDLRLNLAESASLAILFSPARQHSSGIILVDASFFPPRRMPVPIDVGPFEINYEEDPAHAEARFAPWLERVIVAGLNEWRRTL